MQNLKGTKDYLPEEQSIRNSIKRTLEEVFVIYGFRPLETPILCYYDLLSSKYAGGAEILKEIYSLKDQGGRDVALRYDLTVPFAKVVGMNKEMRMPFKRYEIGKVFRDGPVKLGRFREFTQCDVDSVGIKSTIAEAEMIEMVFEVFRRLNLDVIVQYNNRKLLTGFLKSMGIKDEDINYTILSLDKIEKTGEEGVRQELMEKNINPETIDGIFNIISIGADLNLSYFKANYEDEMLFEGIKELEELQGYLKALGVLENAVFNPFLARGLDIYTSTVYEIFLKDKTIASSIGGGGRYDKIIGSFLGEEKEYPAVGISFGLDVIFAALTLKGMTKGISLIDIFIIPMNTENVALSLCKKLREIGFKVEMEMMGRKVRKALDYANKENVPYVVILGEDEVKQELIKVKDMRSGEEVTVGIRELESLKDRLFR